MSTPESFAAELIDTLRRAGCTDDLRHEGDAIIRSKGGEFVSQINLAILYHGFDKAVDRQDYLRHCARIAFDRLRELPEEYELARHDLRTRLFRRASIELQMLTSLAEGGLPKGADLVSFPVGEHLLATLAYDWPETIQTIPPALLEKWGVTTQEAFHDALTNLAHATEGYSSIVEGFYSFVAMDSYDATRILMIELVEQMDVQGSHVILAPNRDAVAITGSEDERGLEVMVSLAEEALDDPHPLTGVLLILEDDRWVDWVPPEDHPLRQRFRELHANWIGPIYSQQKDLLDAIHEETGEDLYVSNYSAVDRRSGGRVSYCVWGEDTWELLPVANNVVFIRKGGKGPAAIANWERVVEVAGHLLVETDHYPKRFRTLGYSNEAQIEEIGMGEL